MSTYTNPFLIQQVKICNKILILCKLNGLEPTFSTCFCLMDHVLFSDNESLRYAACCRQIINNGPPSQFSDVDALEFEDEWGPELANAAALDKKDRNEI